MLSTMGNNPKLAYAFFENLRVPMRLVNKVRMVMGNNWIKMRRLKGCCGNYGQPGC